MKPAELMREGERLMTICNACRYCEGYCAVFPAMEKRLEFPEADLHYLANLCHNCAECYYACQYAPPHEFAVNVPRILAEIRLDSYQRYAWPAPLAKAFQKNGVVVALLLVIGFVIVIGANNGLVGSSPRGDFYRVVSHATMIGVFSAAGSFVVLAWTMGAIRFWRECGRSFSGTGRSLAISRAMRDIFTLEYLLSGGAGCTYPNEHHSQSRRWFHHLTFYGFLLCFASTCVAAVYDNLLGWKAPYPFLSMPVLLGTAGGLGLLIGPAGLAALKLQRDRAIIDPNQDGTDIALITLLLVNALTGLLLLALRNTEAMGMLLMIHLSAVLVLFLAIPYGKFVHGIYRSAALLRYALEFPGAPGRG
jgi:citrate/tricarballylate utilization protein